MVYDFLYGFSAGAHLYFLTRMPSPKIIAQSFSEIRPRVISCVPLIVEKIIKKDILPRIDNKIGKLLLRMPIVNDKIKADMRKKAMEVFGSNFDEIIIGGAPFNAEVERFLDKALLSGFSEVEIVHGRGTGALRRQIHDFLRSFPAVARFATAPEDRGGDGMTIVNLR